MSEPVLDPFSAIRTMFETQQEELRRVKQKLEELEREVAGERVEEPLTKRAFLDRFPSFEKGELDWLLAQRDKNGLAEAVIDGRPLRILASRFFELLPAARKPRRSHGAAPIRPAPAAPVFLPRPSPSAGRGKRRSGSSSKTAIRRAP